MIHRSLLTRRIWGLHPCGWKPAATVASSSTDRFCKPSHFERPSATCTTVSGLHTWSDVSPRDLASLEDRLWQSVGTKVVEPILQKDLGSLKWLDRRIEVAKDGEAAKLTIRLPTQLYPSGAELQEKIQAIASQQVREWISKQKYELGGRIDVEIAAAKPVPAMSKYVENHEELLKQLGPGLVNVSQYLAVYSCKVSVRLKIGDLCRVAQTTF